MSYLFSSESVSEGHPDKIADQISDAILDNFLAQDPNSKVACETLVTTGLVIISGEVTSKAYVDVESIARETIKKIGYNKSEYKFDYESCGFINRIHSQSPDIYRGVDTGGAGDQGMMFGYASSENDNYMPLSLDISHKILIELSKIRKAGKKMKYLRPDAKSQVTLEYDEKHNPIKIKDIVISTQHDDFDEEKKMQHKIKDDIKKILMPQVKKQLNKKIKRLFGEEKYHINPTGKFVIGGPHGDTGLTGRKIIVDTYGGKGTHGGGAFSGKDPSKVDRSAAYATRHIAKNLVAAGISNKILVQVAYAIGIAEPISLYVNTYGTSKINLTDSEIAKKIKNMRCFNLEPNNIIKRLKLKNPIYSETAAYGHMGRETETKIFEFAANNKIKKIKAETFTWEKLDCIDRIKKEFKIS